MHRPKTSYENYYLQSDDFCSIRNVLFSSENLIDITLDKSKVKHL